MQQQHRRGAVTKDIGNEFVAGGADGDRSGRVMAIRCGNSHRLVRERLTRCAIAWSLPRRYPGHFFDIGDVS